MPGKIYLLGDNGSLEPLEEKPYASEDLLQGLLGQYPDLLAGDQINEDAPRRWLLVSREVAVPLEEEGGTSFSLDHLFLDQDAVPTLVEVKRSSDSRIRREVVGQMLDYAAHAIAYWSVDTLRTRFETSCTAEGLDPVQRVAELLGAGGEDQEAVEGFWTQVKTNLQAGRIRLVFVADEIPGELRRVVEFLNRFTDPVEVLAVEIHQYVGEGLKTLVPRVIGQTAQKTAPPPSRQWDEATFFAALEERHGAVASGVARKILQWARPRVTRVWWGKGTRSGSFVAILNHKDTDHQLFAVWTYGTVEIYFQYYQYKLPFESEEARRELLDRLNTIPGVSLPADGIARRPSIALATLQDQNALDQFLAIYDWFIHQILAI